MAQHNQDECLNPRPPQPLNFDKVPEACDPNPSPSLKNPGMYFHDKPNQKVGYGHDGVCDPMMTGQISQDGKNKPERVHDGTLIYQYQKAIRGCDEAIKEMFSNLVCIDELGQIVPVPIIWGTQERAVTHVLQTNIRQDSTLVVHRIQLPIMSVINTGLSPNKERYAYHQAIDYYRRLRPDGKPGFTDAEERTRDTVFGTARGIPIDINYQLTAWTLYVEDMNQILEQILLKFSPIAYIRIQGVHNWETIVKLDSFANNITQEPGDQQLRVVKYQISLTAETFVPQPLVRKKAVLEHRIDFVDGMTPEEITEVLSRLEIKANA